MSLFESTRPLRHGLAGLRRRVRSLLLLLGVSRTVLFLAAMLVVFFLADYFLRLPFLMRLIFLVALLAGTGLVVLRRLLLPLATPLSDDRLAARVEAVHPELEDRFQSSLAFGHAENDPDNEDSPELMRAVVEETVRLSGSIRFQDVARSHVAATWAVGAAVLLFAVGTAAAANSDLVSIFAQRSLLLRPDVEWPRRTTLQVEDMEPGRPRRVTLGRETTLHIRAQGSIPDRVRFSFWEQGAERNRADRIELTPSAEDPALFAFTLRVLTSYNFSVRGGDDDRELAYSIQALTPPAILGVEMDAEYPAYLSRPPETLRGGGQRLPQGTRVRLHVKANMELERAMIALGTEEARPLEREAPDTYGTDLVATKNVRYSVRLVGRNGEENDPGVDTFLLQVAHDLPPDVRVRTPSARTERLAAGVVLIAFHARDDHRIQAAKLHYKVNDGKERTVAAGEAGGDAIRTLVPPEETPERVDGLIVIDIARLRRDDDQPVGRGDRVTFHFAATDSAGKQRRTRSTYRVEVVSEDDLGQTIQGRQQALRDSVRRAEEGAYKAADLRGSLDDVREDGKEFRRLCGRARAAQARVSDTLDAVAQRVQGLVNLYVFNRLDDRSAADQILPYYERHLLEPSDRTGMPFRGPLYRSLWSALQDHHIRAGDAHRKLIEMADLADRLAADHGPRAYRALSRAATAANDPDVTAALTEATSEQKTVTDGLTKLARLMEEWESFEGVLRWFKGLRDAEQDLVNELRDLDKDRKDRR
ncbi:MAG: hypothetical protein ACYTG3_02940 [Planctomycetota bacterium]